MKVLSFFIAALILSLMINDARQPAGVASIVPSSPAPTLEQKHKPPVVLQSCIARDGGTNFMGSYNPEFYEIRVCDSAIQKAAKAIRVPVADLTRYVMTHEMAHVVLIRDKGDYSEQSADRYAVDQLAVEGDLEAIAAQAAIPPDGTAYDFGRGYAKFKLSQFKN
jgi:hypothetical protein